MKPPLDIALEAIGGLCFIAAAGVIWWPASLIVTGGLLIFVAQGMGRNNN